MDTGTVWQMVAVGLAGLAIIWHQYWITNKLRDRLGDVEQRLARVEGFLGIGTPNAAASEAPGADLAYRPQEDPETD